MAWGALQLVALLASWWRCCWAAVPHASPTPAASNTAGAVATARSNTTAGGVWSRWPPAPLAPAVDGQARPCPPRWENIHGRCFRVSRSAHTFESCQNDVCGPAGGTLACVRFEDIHWLAYSVVHAMENADTDLPAAWIGYTAAGEDRTSNPRKGWRWVNGCTSDYTRWFVGEPDNYCGGEDCGAIAAVSGGWLDASCRMRLPCLCEYPGLVTAAWNSSVPGLRDDTCYTCRTHLRWCTAWPFIQLHNAGQDVCRWEQLDGQRRGRGTNECARRVAVKAECSTYFSYSEGRCRCSPATGLHVNCTHRVADTTSDVFRLSDNGAELVHHGQRCVYAHFVDQKYFRKLLPPIHGPAFFLNWLRASAVWLAFGVPCAAVMCYVTWRTCVDCGALARATGSPEDEHKGASGSTAYGPLINAMPGEVDTGEAVNCWIRRGAVGSVVYGLGLLALGATLATQVAGGHTNFGVEFMECLVMAISMGAVARAAFMVNYRLSTIARDVAGPWILVVFFAKLGMAITAFSGMLVFSTLADSDYRNVCLAMYLFRWSLVLALPFQCLGGLAFWRVQVRAQTYVGNGALVGGWVPALVIGNFGSGAGVWWAGYLDSVHEAGGPVALCFMTAAGSQLVAGISLMLANWKVKKYFRKKTETHSDLTPTQIGHAVPECSSTRA